MSVNASGLGTETKSDPLIYCVVPPRLARIQPRLCAHFANNSAVEVVLDQRVGARRAGAKSGRDEIDLDELASRLTPGMERRAIDGRRAAVPVENPVALPPELRRYERDLTFVAGQRWSPGMDEDPADMWRRRAAAAEQQAVELAQALIDAADALRARGGLSPKRFHRLARADSAIERYYLWRVTAGEPPEPLA